MKFKKLVVLDNVLTLPGQRERLEACADEVVYYGNKSDSIDETVTRLSSANACVPCWTELPREVFEKCSQLEYVGFWGHWYHHRIDAEVAREHGVTIDRVPDYGTDAVAELVFAGILERARSLTKSNKKAKRGSYDYEYIKRGKKDEFPQTWLLKGKTIGIVGLGRIGQEVAKKALYGFDMNALYNSRSRKSGWEEKGVEYRELDDLMRESDIVTVHVGHECEEILVTKERLSLMRDGALFVNTSIGNVVDETALITELRSGRFSAFLDVYQGLPPRKELKDLPNVLFTYRDGWYTQESLRIKGDSLVANMEEYLKRQEPNPSLRL